MKLWGGKVKVGLGGARTEDQNTLLSGSGGGIASRNQQGHRLQPLPQASM